MFTEDTNDLIFSEIVLEGDSSEPFMVKPTTEFHFSVRGFLTPSDTATDINVVMQSEVIIDGTTYQAD